MAYNYVAAEEQYELDTMLLNQSQSTSQTSSSQYQSIAVGESASNPVSDKISSSSGSEVVQSSYAEHSDGRYPAKKAWHTKTRSGCAICKKRHLRCDETKPACLRCRKSGLVCPGYVLPEALILEPRNSDLTFHSALEKECFDYKVKIGASVLMGFQPCIRPFGIKLAPQLSHEHEAIKHAVIALGALQGPVHRHTKGPYIARERREMIPFALGHYSKSLRYLANSATSQTSVETALACCILYSAVHLWTEKSCAPLIHAKAALTLLADYRQAVENNERLASSSVDEILAPAIRRFALNAAAFIDGYVPDDPWVLHDSSIDHYLKVPATFTYLDEGLEGIDAVIKFSLIATADPGLFGTYTCAKAKAALTKLLETTGQMTRQNDNKTIKYHCGSIATDYDFRQLFLYHRFAKVILSTFGHFNELAYDEHVPDFVYIVQESQRLLRLEQEATATNPTMFKPSLGMLPSLFMVATKCRVAAIRLKALEILHNVSRIERRFTSCTMTAIARAVIEIEGQLDDQNSLSIVSAEDRIRLDHVRHSKPDDKIFLEYSKSTAAGMPVTRFAATNYIPHPILDGDPKSRSVSRKVVRACGYSGIILFTPAISCHCHADTRVIILPEVPA